MSADLIPGSEGYLQHRLGRIARALALLLMVVPLLLAALYGLWLWQVAEMRDFFTDEAVYAFGIRTCAKLTNDAAFYQQAELILRIIFGLGFAGWILSFVAWGYHTCARARQLVPGSISYRPHTSALLLLVPGINIWMTYLVLRARHRMTVQNASASAPMLVAVLSVLQSLYVLYAASSGFFIPQPGVANGIPLNTVGDMMQELTILLAGGLLQAFSYMAFFTVLGEASAPMETGRVRSEHGGGNN